MDIISTSFTFSAYLHGAGADPPLLPLTSLSRGDPEMARMTLFLALRATRNKNNKGKTMRSVTNLIRRTMTNLQNKGTAKRTVLVTLPVSSSFSSDGGVEAETSVVFSFSTLASSGVDCIRTEIWAGGEDTKARGPKSPCLRATEKASTSVALKKLNAAKNARLNTNCCLIAGFWVLLSFSIICRCCCGLWTTDTARITFRNQIQSVQLLAKHTKQMRKSIHICHTLSHSLNFELVAS